MKRQLHIKNRGLVLGFAVLSLLLCIVIAFMAGKLFSTDIAPVSKDKKALASKEITVPEVEKVQGQTLDFFNSFRKTKAIPEEEKYFTDVSYKYLSRDFMENVFPQFNVKTSLFGIYGFDRFTSSRVHLDESENVVKTTTGAIKTFEIYRTDKDNVNRTVTTYVRLDGLRENERYWIEWRDIPGEGWKINAVSFVKTLDELKKPLSPKQKL